MITHPLAPAIRCIIEQNDEDALLEIGKLGPIDDLFGSSTIDMYFDWLGYVPLKVLEDEGMDITDEDERRRFFTWGKPLNALIRAGARPTARYLWNAVHGVEIEAVRRSVAAGLRPHPRQLLMLTSINAYSKGHRRRMNRILGLLLSGRSELGSVARDILYYVSASAPSLMRQLLDLHSYSQQELNMALQSILDLDHYPGTYRRAVRALIDAGARALAPPQLARSSWGRGIIFRMENVVSDLLASVLSRGLVRYLMVGL